MTLSYMNSIVFYHIYQSLLSLSFTQCMYVCMHALCRLALCVYTCNNVWMHRYICMYFKIQTLHIKTNIHHVFEVRLLLSDYLILRYFYHYYYHYYFYYCCHYCLGVEVQSCTCYNMHVEVREQLLKSILSIHLYMGSRNQSQVISFLIESRTTSPGMASPTMSWALPNKSQIRKILYRLAYSQIYGGIFSIDPVPFIFIHCNQHIS